MINIAESSQEDLLRILLAYQQAVDASVISSITDIKGTIRYVNKKFCEVSKYSKEELIGQNHRIISSNHHPENFFKNMWATIGKGEVWYGEIKNKAKDGTFYWVDSVIVPIKNQQGKPIQYLSLRTLISERKAKEEKKKEEYTRAIEEMLFKISHQVRQPVVQILGVAHLLNHSSLNQDELQVIMNGMQQSAMLLDNYTRELTTFISQLDYSHPS